LSTGIPATGGLQAAASMTAVRLTALSVRGRMLERASSSARAWFVINFDHHTFARRWEHQQPMTFRGQQRSA